MERDINVPEKVIYVCNGPKCKKKGGKELKKFFKNLFKKDDKVKVIKTGCTDNCKNAPIVCVQPDNAWYPKVDTVIAKSIINSVGGDVINENQNKAEETEGIP